MSEQNPKLQCVHVNSEAREYRAKEGYKVTLDQVFGSNRTLFADRASVGMYIILNKKHMLTDGQERYFGYLEGTKGKALRVFRSDPSSPDTSFTLREESIDLNKQEFSSVSPVRFVIPF